MAKRSVVHVQHSYDRHTGNGPDLGDREVRILAAHIVEQAVSDWIFLIHIEDLAKRDPDRAAGYRQTKVGNSNYEEIRKFFRSDYCDALCDAIGLHQSRILHKLESWLSEYRRSGVMPNYLGYTTDTERD